MTWLDDHSISLGVGFMVGATKFDTDANTPFAGRNGGNQADLAPLIGSHGVFRATDDLTFGMTIWGPAL